MGAGPFAGVTGRDSVDYLRRSTQQQLVALGGQMSHIVRDDGAIDRAIVAGTYDQGVDLSRAECRYLRVSCACFIAAFITAGVALAITATTR